MYEITLEITNPEVIEKYVSLFSHMPEQLLQVTQESADEYSKIVEEELGQEPGPVHYPILWQTELQRKAFFASGGFDKGIPYKRTGTLVRSWEATAVAGDDQFPVSIEVRNFDPAYPYVQGEWQQAQHYETGWTYAPEALDKIGSRFRNSMARRIGIMFRRATGGE